MAVKIIYDYIAEGMRNRPMTNPASSLYGKVAKHEWITHHEPWSTADEEQLHRYVKSTRAAERPASWHQTVGLVRIFQALPWDESGWHAGDNLGPGNTRSIGKEVCDYPLRRQPQDYDLFWRILENSAHLDAYIIQNVETLLPFPDCMRIFPDLMKQHNHWSGKNCPYYLRGMPNGWDKYLEMVSNYLKETEYKELEPGDQFWVIVGSYTVIENALRIQQEINNQGLPAEIRHVIVNGRDFYRVVVGCYQYNEYKEAINMDKALRGLGFHPTILEVRKEIIVLDPLPTDTFPDEYDAEYDPDLDREWIEDNKDQFKGGKDPYQDALPTGLLAILRALYEWLKQIFE